MSENKRLLLRVTCVALVVSVVFPVGQLLLPMAANAIGVMPFNAIEAVVAATLGFGLFEVLYR